MSPAILAIIFGRRRVLVTKTYTANTTVVIPTTTNRIETASGKGAAGTPAGPSQSYYSVNRQTTYYYRNGNVSVVDQGTEYNQTGSHPSNYCASYNTPEDPNVTGFSNCYYYSDYTVQSPAKTGASTTAFGKTFPGGTGGAAPTTNFSAIAVTPGGSYNIVVPAGGSLTITYYE